MVPHSSILPGKSHGRRSLEGCSPWGCWGSDMTEWLHFHFSLSWVGEGNGNPLQCSCLENPRDGGAWWAAVSGVAQSWTQLKWLSSSSRKETEALLILPIFEINNGFDTKDSKIKDINFGRYLQIFNEALISWSVCLGRHTRNVRFISLS